MDCPPSLTGPAAARNRYGLVRSGVFPTSSHLPVPPTSSQVIYQSRKASEPVFLNSKIGYVGLLVIQRLVSGS